MHCPSAVSSLRSMVFHLKNMHTISKHFSHVQFCFFPLRQPCYKAIFYSTDVNSRHDSTTELLQRKGNGFVSVKEMVSLWRWMKHHGIKYEENHYSTMIISCFRVKRWKDGLQIMQEMKLASNKPEKVYNNLFHRILKREKWDSVAYNGLVNGMLAEGMWKEALKICIFQQRAGYSLGATTQKFSEFRREIKESGIQLTRETGNTFINMSPRFFKSIQDAGLQPTIATYDPIFDTLHNARNYTEILELFENLKETKLQPHLRIYELVINILKDKKDWKQVLQIFMDIQNTKLQPNIKLYHLVFISLQEAKQWKKILNIFEILEKKKLQPTMETYTYFINALYEKCKWKKVEDVFRNLQNAKLHPSLETCTIAIQKEMQNLGIQISYITSSELAKFAYGEKKWYRLFAIFRKIKKSEFYSNASIYNIMINEMIINSKWMIAFKISLDKQRAGFHPDTTTYKLLNAVRQEEGLTHEVQKMWREIRNSKVQPSLKISNAFICTLQNDGKWHIGLRIFRSMQNMGLQPDSKTYIALINTMKKEGEWKTALKLFKIMQEEGLQPDLEIYTAVINTMKGNNLSTTAWKLFMSMRKAGLTPNATLFNRIFDILYRDGKWKNMLNVFKVMKQIKLQEKELHPYPEICNFYIKMQQRKGKWKSGLKLLEKMHNVRVKPLMDMYLFLVRTIIEEDEIEEAIKMSKQMQESGLLGNDVHRILIYYIQNEKQQQQQQQEEVLSRETSMPLKIFREMLKCHQS